MAGHNHTSLCHSSHMRGEGCFWCGCEQSNRPTVVFGYFPERCYQVCLHPKSYELDVGCRHLEHNQLVCLPFIRMHCNQDTTIQCAPMYNRLAPFTSVVSSHGAGCCAKCTENLNKKNSLNMQDFFPMSISILCIGATASDSNRARMLHNHTVCTAAVCVQRFCFCASQLLDLHATAAAEEPYSA